MKEIEEKLIQRGASSLSDLELLTTLLDGVPQRASVAQSILDLCDGDLKALSTVDFNRLRMAGDLGAVRAARVVAACELGRRAISVNQRQMEISGSADVVEMFRPLATKLQHEECWALHLNAANRVVEIQQVSRGGVAATMVDNRLIIKRALELLSSHIILVHNHPSGAVEPSGSDIELTRSLRSALSLFNLTMLDHIIISAEGEFSFAGSGMLN